MTFSTFIEIKLSLYLYIPQCVHYTINIIFKNSVCLTSSESNDDKLTKLIKVVRCLFVYKFYFKFYFTTKFLTHTYDTLINIKYTSIRYTILYSLFLIVYIINFIYIHIYNII